MAVRRTIMTVGAVVLMLGLVPLAPPSVSADPVLVSSTCTADGPMTPTGTVTVQVPFLGAVTLPFPALGQPIAEALDDLELPVPLPVDLASTPQIESGGTIEYATDVALDLGTGIEDLFDVVRAGLTAAGFPGLADTLEARVTLDDLTIPFPHPSGTAGASASVLGSTPASASHAADAMELVIDRFTVSTQSGADTLDVAAAWSVTDQGTAAPAQLVQRLGDIRFDLDVRIEGTLPAELVELLLADVLPIPVSGDLPISAGAVGPWTCTPDAEVALATTDVIALDPTLLRVTTDPPLPTTITLDGEPRGTFGLDWVTVPPGEHLLCFSDVPGFALPACETIDVAPETITTVAASAEVLGVLSVQVDPAGLPATVLVDGVARDGYGLLTWMPPGNHEVCWGAVEGWASPDCEAVIVVAGQTSTVVGAFTPGGTILAPPSEPTGRLTVASQPLLPTTVSVDGLPRNTWRLEALPLAVGEHQVCFSDVPGFVTPPCQQVTVTTGGHLEVVGEFVPGLPAP